MKLTALFIFIMILHANASVLAQKVTLSEKNTSLSRVFEKIRTQTGYDFLVTKRMLDQAKPVNIDVAKTDLEDVLAKIFENQNLNFSIKSKSIIVSYKPQHEDNKTLNTYLLIDISGKIVDSNGKAIHGATIKVKNSDESTMSGADGVFKLKTKDSKVVLEISFIGFE